MADYTEHYQLHQWQPQDPFLRSDFNQDFSKIDTALSQATKSIVGTYVGNAPDNENSYDQEIHIGVCPKAVLVWGVYDYWSVDYYPSYHCMTIQGQDIESILCLSKTGFTAGQKVYGSSVRYPNLNALGQTYHYIALC